MKQCMRRWLSAVVIPVLFLALGCSDQASPVDVAPEPEIPAVSFSQGQGGPDLSQIATFQTKPQITIAWAKKWIGPEGGRLDFHGFAIEVPPGAVDRITQFSISLPVDPNGSEHVVAEFGPHNQTFGMPVAIELPYANSSLAGNADATVLWWDDATDVWVDMGGAVTSDGQRLRTTTPHFSTYGTGETSYEGGVLGGGG